MIFILYVATIFGSGCLASVGLLILYDGFLDWQSCGFSDDAIGCAFVYEPLWFGLFVALGGGLLGFAAYLPQKGGSEDG